MKDYNKRTHVTGLVLFLMAGCYLFIHIAFDGMYTGPSYNDLDQIENFKQKEIEIFEARDYLKHTLQVEADFFIEFDGSKVDIFRLVINGRRKYSKGEDLTPQRIDSLLQQINWTNKELSILRKKLEAANCISIDNWDNIRLGWKRKGMGKFYYLLLEQPFPTPYKGRNHSCAYIRYRPDVVLEYGGGAFGPDCFPGRSKQN